MAQWPSGPDKTTNWLLRIYPYVKSVQVYNCPSADFVWDGTQSTSVGVKYGVNDSLFMASDATPLASIVRPSETLMVADSDGPASYDIKRANYTGPSSPRHMSDRHLNGANLAYADGHAKWISIARDASDLTIHPTASRGVYWAANGVN